MWCVCGGEGGGGQGVAVGPVGREWPWALAGHLPVRGLVRVGEAHAAPHAHQRNDQHLLHRHEAHALRQLKVRDDHVRQGERTLAGSGGTSPTDELRPRDFTATVMNSEVPQAERFLCSLAVPSLPVCAPSRRSHSRCSF